MLNGLISKRTISFIRCAGYFSKVYTSHTVYYTLDRGYLASFMR